MYVIYLWTLCNKVLLLLLLLLSSPKTYFKEKANKLFEFYIIYVICYQSCLISGCTKTGRVSVHFSLPTNPELLEDSAAGKRLSNLTVQSTLSTLADNNETFITHVERPHTHTHTNTTVNMPFASSHICCVSCWCAL